MYGSSSFFVKCIAVLVANGETVKGALFVGKKRNEPMYVKAWKLRLTWLRQIPWLIKAAACTGYRKEYAPTLLHFAAMYGLRNLTALLLRCPGSVRAYGTANCDGDYPTNLAEKAGHWDLKDYMKSYMVSTLCNELLALTVDVCRSLRRCMLLGLGVVACVAAGSLRCPRCLRDCFISATWKL